MQFIQGVRTLLSVARHSRGLDLLDLALALLLVGAVLVHPKVQDLAVEQGPGVVEEDEEVDGDEADRHDGPDPHGALALQGAGDVDGGEGEPDVGEDKGPAVEAEAREGLVDRQAGHDRDREEPQRQAPDEDRREQREDAYHLCGRLVRPEEVVPPGPVVCEADDGERGEAGRADGDEHAWARFGGREAVVDHATHVARVHAHRHHHPKPLRREPAEEHRHCVFFRLVLDPAARDRPAQHEREDGQVPCGRHVLDLEPRVREEQAVHPHRDEEARREVDPEEHPVHDHQPVPAAGDRIVRGTGDDARHGNQARREE